MKRKSLFFLCFCLVSIFFLIVLRLQKKEVLDPELEKLLQRQQVTDPASQELLSTHPKVCETPSEENLLLLIDIELFILPKSPKEKTRNNCFKFVFQLNNRHEFIGKRIQSNLSKDQTELKKYTKFLIQMATRASTAGDRVYAALALSEDIKKFPSLKNTDLQNTSQITAYNLFSETYENEILISRDFLNDSAVYNSLSAPDPLVQKLNLNTLFFVWKNWLNICRECFTELNHSQDCVIQALLQLEKSPDLKAQEKLILRNFFSFSLFKQTRTFSESVKQLR